MTPPKGKRNFILGCSIAQWLAYLLPDPDAPGLIPRGKNINVAEVNQLRWSEESELWLENVGRSHLALTSGKLVLHKTLFSQFQSLKQPKQIDDDEKVFDAAY